MCVIAYSAKNEFLVAALRVCEKNNPDGIGVMANYPDFIRIRKGFKTLDEAIKFSKTLGDVPVAFHFRIATHGVVSAGNCHPFGIGLSHAEVVDGDVPSAMMHNGIIGMTSGNHDVSDSYVFARDYLPRFRKLDKVDIGLISEATHGSRLLIFKKGGTVCATGDWKKEKEIFYSNGTYKAYEYPLYNGKSWKDYSYDKYPLTGGAYGTGYNYGKEYTEDWKSRATPLPATIATATEEETYVKITAKQAKYLYSSKTGEYEDLSVFQGDLYLRDIGGVYEHKDGLYKRTEWDYIYSDAGDPVGFTQLV